MKQFLLLALFMFTCSSSEQNSFNKITSVLVKTNDDKANISTRWETDVHFDCNVDLTKYDISFYHKFDGSGPIVSGKVWVTPKESKTPPKFRDDYEFKPGFGFYKLHDFLANWTTARQICNKEGAHLTILNSQAESDLIVNIFNEKKYPALKDSRFIALGFHDFFTENEFVTIQGDPLASTGFFKWSLGQPDNYKGSENCGSIYIENGLLNDIQCAGKVAFICEKEIK